MQRGEQMLHLVKCLLGADEELVIDWESAPFHSLLERVGELVMGWGPQYPKVG